MLVVVVVVVLVVVVVVVVLLLLLLLLPLQILVLVMVVWVTAATDDDERVVRHGSLYSHTGQSSNSNAGSHCQEFDQQSVSLFFHVLIVDIFTIPFTSIRLQW